MYKRQKKIISGFIPNMQITFNTSLKLNNIRKPDIRNSYPNLSPLKHDTVTFGGNKIGVIKEMNETNYLEKQVIKIKSDLKEAIEKNDASRIFEYFGIDVEADKSGLLTISEYRQPLSDITYSDVGIDENKLFEKIKTIQEDADFTNSQVIDLGNLKSIGGDANFAASQIRNLGKLESIGGDADFVYSQITNLGNLKTVGGQVDYNTQAMEKLLEKRGLI